MLEGKRRCRRIRSACISTCVIVAVLLRQRQCNQSSIRMVTAKCNLVKCAIHYLRFVCACLSKPFILQYAFHCIYSVFNTFVLPRITSSRTPSIRWANGSSGRLRPLSPMPTSLAQISVLQVECYLCWPLVGPVLVTVGHHCHWNLQQLCLSARPPFHQY